MDKCTKDVLDGMIMLSVAGWPSPLTAEIDQVHKDKWGILKRGLPKGEVEWWYKGYHIEHMFDSILMRPLQEE